MRAKDGRSKKTSEELVQEVILAKDGSSEMEREGLVLDMFWT